MVIIVRGLLLKGIFATVSIWQVSDCVLHTYQTEMKSERATAVEFTTVTPICYIHC
jgi:hypothetical protein